MYIAKNKNNILPVHLKKNKSIYIRVTEDYRSQIKKQAKKAGLGISDYFRKAVSVMEESQGEK